MTKSEIKNLESRVRKIEPNQTSKPDNHLKQALAQLSPDEQANLCHVIIALENKPPELSYEQCIASLPEEQRAVVEKTQRLLNAYALPIEQQVALKMKELEATPGAFDCGPNLEDLSKSSAKARDRKE